MVEVSAAPEQIEERKDLGDGDEALWRYWDIQESIADREEREWKKEARKIYKRFRDERSITQKGKTRFNILWSNVQTLQPLLYGRMPKPDCQRRYHDQDDIGRLASTLLERAIGYCIEEYGFDDAMKAAVQDRLLPGRGVLRVRYVPHYGDKLPDEDADGSNEFDDDATATQNGDSTVKEENPPAGTDQPIASALDPDGSPEPPQELREVVWEEARVEYVYWEDYREGPARRWSEVPWLRYRSYMTRSELAKRFGKTIAQKVELDYTPRGADRKDEDAPPDAYKKAIIYETWDKTKKETVWWAPGTPDLILDRLDDPLKLRGFFPSGDPLLATTTNDSRIPVPDYHEYEDQAKQLDTLSARIERLEAALKVAGIYPGEEKQTLQQLLSPEVENILIPVDNWQAIVDKQGMEGMIQWLPIKDIAATLTQLYDARDKAKQVLYEITGIADILRAQTDPQETLGAQRLKSQYATLRSSEPQKAVARLARDTIRLVADIIGTHFAPRTISEMTGYPQLVSVPPQPAPPPMPPEMLAAQPPAGLPGGAPVPVAAQPARTPMGIPAAPSPSPQAPPGQSPHPAPSPAMQQYQQAMGAFQQQQAARNAAIAQNQQRHAQFDAAVALIKDDVLHGFRIDVEADSTIAIDEQAEKQARTEYLQQMVPMLEQVIPFAQGVPPMAAFVKEIVLFATRAFKAARPLEEALEEAFDAIGKMPPNPNGPAGKGKGAGGKSPAGEIAMAQADMKDSQLKAQAAQHDTDTKVQAAEQANQIKMLQIQSTAEIAHERLALEAREKGARLNLESAAQAHEQAIAASNASAGAAARAVGSLP